MNIQPGLKKVKNPFVIYGSQQPTKVVARGELVLVTSVLRRKHGRPIIDLVVLGTLCQAYDCSPNDFEDLD